MTFIQQLKDIVNADVTARLALYIAEPQDRAAKAVEGMLYTLFGGLLKRSTTEIGVEQLYNLLQRPQFDGRLTENLSTTLRDATLTHTLITQGNEAASQLLPAMKSAVGTLISSYASIRNSSAISLLGLLTAVTLDALAKRVRDQKLDADTLASQLYSEREAFLTNVPESLLPALADKLGITHIVAGASGPARRSELLATGRSSSTARSAPTPTYEPAEETSGSGFSGRWAIGLLLVAVMGVGGYFIYQNTQQYADADETTEYSDDLGLAGDSIRTDTVARSMAVPTETLPQQTPPASTSAAAPGSTTALAGTPGSSTATAGIDKIAAYVGDPTASKGRVFVLRGLTFEDGTATLTPDGQTQLTELADLLKQKTNFGVQIQSYANDAPADQTNKSLSTKRALAIKQALVQAGINYIRVDAVGYGTGVKADSTGRPLGQTVRRIDLKVVYK